MLYSQGDTLVWCTLACPALPCLENEEEEKEGGDGPVNESRCVNSFEVGPVETPQAAIYVHCSVPNTSISPGVMQIFSKYLLNECMSMWVDSSPSKHSTPQPQEIAISLKSGWELEKTDHTPQNPRWTHSYPLTLLSCKSLIYPDTRSPLCPGVTSPFCFPHPEFTVSTDGAGGGMKTTGVLCHNPCPLGISALQAWKVKNVSYSGLKETQSEPGFWVAGSKGSWQMWQSLTHSCFKCLRVERNVRRLRPHPHVLSCQTAGKPNLRKGPSSAGRKQRWFVDLI